MNTIKEINKLDFDHLEEWAETNRVFLEVKFRYKDDIYIAKSLFDENSGVIEDVDIYDEEYNHKEYDDKVECIAYHLLARIKYNSYLKTEI